MMRPEKEIEEMMHEANDIVDQGGSDVPGMSYEEGVAAGLLWALDQTDDRPIQEMEEG